MLISLSYNKVILTSFSLFIDIQCSVIIHLRADFESTKSDPLLRSKLQECLKICI